MGISVRRAPYVGLVLFWGACGGAAEVDGGAPGDAGPAADASVIADAGLGDGGTDLDASSLLDASVDGAVPAGPVVYVHLRSTHAPVAHPAGTVGQTPRDWVSGIRSLHLLRTMDDPSPVLVFSHGDGFVEASYADGADTVVGSAPAASLPSATFTWARAVHTHVRFTVDATAHVPSGSYAGAFEDLIVLSDRTTLDGVVYPHGQYRYVFHGPGFDVPFGGSGFEVQPIAGGGFNARLEAGETAYYFPAVIAVDPAVTEDVHFVFEVNVHEGFRWTDQADAGYATGVFDVSTAGAEPIVQAGANAYRYRVE